MSAQGTPMLTPADQALVRQDRTIPGLALVLNPESLIDALGPQLIESTVTGVAVTYVRYKPGRNCLVGYRLQTGNGSLDLYATAYGPDAANKISKRVQRLIDSEPVVRPMAVWPETAIVVHAFPNDEVLKFLHQIADADSRAALLQKLLPDLPALWDTRVECLRYKPLRRYVARLHGIGNVSAVLKMFDDHDGPNALTAAKSLHSIDTLHTRRPLGRSRNKQLLVLEWLEGETLADLMMNPHRAGVTLSATGVALQALHSQSTSRLPIRTPIQDAAAVAAVAEWVAQVYPPLARECQQLADALAERLRAYRACQTVVHGDFHSKQVLASGSRIAILDLDCAARGHPAIDLGGFQADLEHEALTGRLSAAVAQQLGETFLNGYAAAGGTVERSPLAVYTAAGLMRLAPEFFRRREPEWPERMAALIGRARTLLDRSTPISTEPATADNVTLNDPEIALLAQAVDTTQMESSLLTALQSAPGICAAGPLRRPRVLRHKPGRRYLIEYILSDSVIGQPLPMLGKIRVKGLDRKTYALNQTLWHNGFGPGSPDQIQVPKPLGLVPTLNMSLQQKVSGVVSTALFLKHDGIRVAKQVAEALYKLHRHGPAPFRRHRVADELRILKSRLDAVIQGHPQWRSRIESILEACRNSATAIPLTTEGPIHRDFYPDQVLIDGSKVYLLDLDLYARGDPAVDVGNFVAHIQEYALRLYGDPDALNGPTEHLVARYLTLNTDTSRDAIRAYTTLSLARLIAISQRIPERRRFTVALMTLCEHRLGISATHHAVTHFA